MNEKWIIALLLAGSLGAAPQSDTGKPKGKTSSGPMESLANKYHADSAQIRDMRSKGMGWDEIGKTLAVSEKAKLSSSDVEKQRKSGMSWDDIARQHGMTPQQLESRGREIEQAGKAAESKELQNLKRLEPGQSGQQDQTPRSGSGSRQKAPIQPESPGERR